MHASWDGRSREIVGRRHREVAGTFEDGARARGAVDALQRAGVEAGEIKLVGDVVDREAASEDVAMRERAGMLHVALRALAGAIAGGSFGGLAGFILGSLAYGLPSPMSTGLWAFTLAGAIAVGSAGAVVAGIRSISLTEDWELSFTPEPGAVTVAVHAEDDEDLEFAMHLLEETGARDVRTYGVHRRAG